MENLKRYVVEVGQFGALDLGKVRYKTGDIVTMDESKAESLVKDGHLRPAVEDITDRYHKPDPPADPAPAATGGDAPAAPADAPNPPAAPSTPSEGGNQPDPSKPADPAPTNPTAGSADDDINVG